jgi:hypothetical protein
MSPSPGAGARWRTTAPRCAAAGGPPARHFQAPHGPRAPHATLAAPTTLPMACQQGVCLPSPLISSQGSGAMVWQARPSRFRICG